MPTKVCPKCGYLKKIKRDNAYCDDCQVVLYMEMVSPEKKLRVKNGEALNIKKFI